MRAVKSVSIDSERRVIITYLDGSTETLYPNCIWCDSEALRQLIKDLLEEKADAITQTIENVTIASFADGADEGLIKKLLVSIEPIQEGTGDPSPENIRPIVGRTGLTVYKRGANLVDDSIKNINTPGTTLYVGGAANAYAHFLKAGKYTLSCDFADGVHYGAIIKETNSDQITIWGSNTDIDQATFTLSIDGFYRLGFYQSASSGGVSVDGVSNIILTCGETALPYEPYKGETYSFNWESEAGTVYSGTLDVVSGKLVIDRAGNVYDGSSDENWSRYLAGSASAFAMRIDVAGMKESTAGSNIVISNELKSLAYNAQWGSYDSFISTQSGMAVLVAGIKTITTVDDWRAYLESSPLQVVYELATPTEIQLTPQEVTTLLGDNNIWADSGNILELEYTADTKLYIGEQQSGVLGSGTQSITKPDLQPVSDKTWEDVAEAYKEEATDERGEE